MTMRLATATWFDWGSGQSLLGQVGNDSICTAPLVDSTDHLAHLCRWPSKNNAKILNVSFTRIFGGVDGRHADVCVLGRADENTAA
jgi:hypothetical protein